jgi:2EXR family
VQSKPGDGRSASDVGEIPVMHVETGNIPGGGVTLNSGHRDNFTLFPNLLFEIRTMIWDEICKEPRIVEVEVQGYYKPERNGIRAPPSDPGFTPRGPAPALLHVCKEARYQGLKHYTRVLQRLINHDHVPDTVIYMNLEVDTLCILPPKMQIGRDFYRDVTRGCTTTSSVARKSGQIIRRIVVPMLPTALFNGFNVNLLGCCCGLKEVVLARNWEVRADSLIGEPPSSQYSSYARVRTLMEPEICANMEDEEYVKILKQQLERTTRRIDRDPKFAARRAKFVFGALTWTQLVA